MNGAQSRDADSRLARIGYLVRVLRSLPGEVRLSGPGSFTASGALQELLTLLEEMLGDGE